MMDPPTMMNRTSYNHHQSNLAGSYSNLSEIWSFPITIGGGDDQGRLEMRRASASFGSHFSHFGGGGVEDVAVCGGDLMGGEVKERNQRRGMRKEEVGKSVSSSNSRGGVGGCGGAMQQHDSDSKRQRSSRNEGDSNDDDGEGISGKERAEQQQISKPTTTPEPQKDYIHVRARRGQATDSHSLAERARREKISERMKILQDIVPGCNKVIGKALVLDEIINYIQSLQRQVEFLSMKLEAVNSRMSEGYASKDLCHQLYDPSGGVSYHSREFNRGISPDWLHMQQTGGGGGSGGSCFDRQT